MTARMTYVPLSPLAPRTLPDATVLCLGNFDGVHAAHRALMSAARELRDKSHPHAACGVLCFAEYPSDVLRRKPMPHLCTPEERLDLFGEAGMEFAILLDFPTLRDLSPEAFVTELLSRELHCVGAVCGFNYSFGKDGAGTPSLLTRHLASTVLVLPPVMEGGEPVSSTRIRALIKEGELEPAARLLARPYGFSAPVLHGKRLGRTIGIPTVNQSLPEGRVLPPRGVYVTECTVDGQTYRGVTNIGKHPTVDNDAAMNAETFLLDFSGEIYGSTVSLSFLRRLRPERRFDSLEELRRQILDDVAAARAYQIP